MPVYVAIALVQSLGAGLMLFGIMLVAIVLTAH